MLPRRLVDERGLAHAGAVKRFIKAVGAGSKRARALTRDEAREAMSLIAAGAAEPVQVGAFLLALRMKGESPDELAGFADAFARHVPAPAACPAGTLEVDAHGDGHGDLPSLLVAAACAAAAEGVPVCLSLEVGSPFSRHGLDAALGLVGLDGALDPARAAADLARAGVAACDLTRCCPPLARLVALRPLLGVRSAAQTVAKLLSPFASPTARLVGVFHAPYLEPTARALGLLGIDRALVAQALGGLPEARPGRLLRVMDTTGAGRTIDLRSLAREPAAPPSASASVPDLNGAAATRAALDAQEPQATRAAAAAALLLHAATGADPLLAAAAAHAALQQGRARAIADRLGRR